MTDTRQVTVERCQDVNLIDTFSSEFAPFLGTDQAHTIISAREWINNPRVVAMLARIDGEPMGIVVFHDNEAHTMFRKPLRGKLGIQAGKMIIDWIFKNTKMQAITSFAYSNRPDVLTFCRWLGFQVTCIQNNNATINGQPVDRINLIIEK